MLGNGATYLTTNLSLLRYLLKYSCQKTSLSMKHIVSFHCTKLKFNASFHKCQLNAAGVLAFRSVFKMSTIHQHRSFKTIASLVN